ncbi:hypothetical protein NUU61_004135 [Penicillium alfredii]|uniref:DUF614 domain protein n=1 Tax=Penicillium alfredii TaxID=1506179 RepID=A0A9W9FKP8_9EURO|nr:uncharacterized protein NUU61_004135 [Penicillium alfredii]KAJ5101913.1 hypothetical protein NUU61_004135 [Penicillium alfredii]
MHPPDQHQSHPTSSPPLPATSNTFSPQLALQEPPAQHHQPAPYESNEKIHQLQQDGIIPTYSNLPPPEQHPAHHAPLADSPDGQPDIQMSPYSPNQALYSQHPMPLKLRTDAPTRSNTVTVEPDANPLQSPYSPCFPPPTATTASQAATMEDLSSFHQPGQIMHPNQEVQGGTWSHGLCECSNIGTCCLGIFCPCIIYGKTQHRLSMKSKKEDPTNMLGYGTCNGACTGMALLCGCQWLLATIQHTRTRKAYGIPGSIVSDCVRATCCTCCTLIQDEKEIQTREEQRDRAARERGATLLSPYTAPRPMSYAPPPR